MREIKFRGKQINNGEWRYGYLMQMHKPNRMFIGIWEYIGGEATIKDELFFSYKEVDPDTIGQFTGLLDKNGKEIYEGDMLRLLETISTDDPAYPYYCDTMEVCYCEPHCRFGLTDGGAILDIPSNVEVIGNKFENPDLC